MFYFESRSKARQFAAIKGRKVTDNGKDAVKRWAVKVL